MKKHITIQNIILITVFALIIISIAGTKSSYKPTRFFNKSGEVYGQLRVFVDSFICTTGNGMTIDISQAGFNVVRGVSAIAQRNTGTATAVPKVGIKSYTTTSVSVNVYEGNSNTVDLLGSAVLLGTSESFVADPSTITIHIMAIGY